MKRRIHVLPPACMCTQLLHADNKAAYRACKLQALCGMQVGQLVRNFTDQAVALGQVILQDGKWHMLTLTTLWDGTPGYAMLVDGQLTGVLNGNYTYTGISQALYSYTLTYGAKNNSLASLLARLCLH